MNNSRLIKSAVLIFTLTGCDGRIDAAPIRDISGPDTAKTNTSITIQVSVNPSGESTTIDLSHQGNNPYNILISATNFKRVSYIPLFTPNYNELDVSTRSIRFTPTSTGTYTVECSNFKPGYSPTAKSTLSIEVID